VAVAHLASPGALAAMVGYGARMIDIAGVSEQTARACAGRSSTLADERWFDLVVHGDPFTEVRKGGTGGDALVVSA
jgi:hypothetical protein